MRLHLDTTLRMISIACYALIGSIGPISSSPTHTRHRFPPNASIHPATRSPPLIPTLWTTSAAFRALIGACRSPLEPSAHAVLHHAPAACIGAFGTCYSPTTVYFTPTRPFINPTTFPALSPRVDHAEPSFRSSHSPLPFAATLHAFRTPLAPRHTLPTSRRYMRVNIIFFNVFFLF